MTGRINRWGTCNRYTWRLQDCTIVCHDYSRLIEPYVSLDTYHLRSWRNSSDYHTFYDTFLLIYGDNPPPPFISSDPSSPMFFLLFFGRRLPHIFILVPISPPPLRISNGIAITFNNPLPMMSHLQMSYMVMPL